MAEVAAGRRRPPPLASFALTFFGQPRSGRAAVHGVRRGLARAGSYLRGPVGPAQRTTPPWLRLKGILGLSSAAVVSGGVWAQSAAKRKVNGRSRGEKRLLPGFCPAAFTPLAYLCVTSARVVDIKRAAPVARVLIRNRPPALRGRSPSTRCLGEIPPSGLPLATTRARLDRLGGRP